MQLILRLNGNQWVLSALAIVVSILGFFITNSNITKRKQEISWNSKGNQASEWSIITDNSRSV